MAVRLLEPDEFEIYKEIRLDALRADPGAFASTYERESQFADSTWRERLKSFGGRPGCTFVDEVDAVVVATAAVGFTEWDDTPMLVGMWVRPEARGLGSARRLITSCSDWAESQGADSIVLWVVTDNEPAISLYRSCGFVDTGRTDTVPSNPCSDELEMRRPIG